MKKFLVLLAVFLLVFERRFCAAALDQELLQQKMEITRIAENLREKSFHLRGQVEEISRQLVQIILAFKNNPNGSPNVIPVLDHLVGVFGRFSNHFYCQEDPAAMIRVITREMLLTIDKVNDAKELPYRLKGAIVLPEDSRLEDNLPENIPLEQFKNLGAITIFLMKHRMSYPSSYVQTQSYDLAAGKYNVEVGVILRGKVRNIHLFSGDQDIVFDIDMIHCEITPTWRKEHPEMVIPKEGDLVEIRGWSYYDIFHADESQEEGEVETKKRQTVWEVHPVQQVVILDLSKRAK